MPSFVTLTKEIKMISVPGCHVFVQHPDHWGCWIKTHISVITVACPQCLAKKGFPCRGSQKRYQTLTHGVRRGAHDAAQKALKKGKKR